MTRKLNLTVLQIAFLRTREVDWRDFVYDTETSELIGPNGERFSWPKLGDSIFVKRRVN